MSSVIEVEDLSKLYRLGEVGTGTLQHDINRWWHRVRGKEDPYAKVGRVNDRTLKSGDGGVKALPDYVWALKDVNFKVNQGEVLGIIGRNGAGKSTLLKLLSRVTSPTTGSIKVKGRIASLLEVGTGFHPELSGRENIYLNGAILGMHRHEITSKLDEIVDFSGCAAYLDTPVKRYSSGMYVRLAFGVAAHLDPEILIVDEVLAVGDAEFQKRCLSRMDKVSKQGKTVIFVSHNMGSVQSLCTSILRMSSGHVSVKSQNIEKEISAYLNDCKVKNLVLPISLDHTSQINEIEIGPTPVNENQPVSIVFEIEFLEPTVVTDFAPILYNQTGVRVCKLDGRPQLGLPREFSPGIQRFKFTLPALALIPGNYMFGLYYRTHATWVSHDYLGDFQLVSDQGISATPYPVEFMGVMQMNFNAEQL
jgi:lipopolysaccharide transport system ATP-binding protein